MTTTEFAEWLSQELRSRYWTPATLANEAGTYPATITRILSGERNPGPDVCVAIANALNYPPELVFRKAGILPNTPHREPSSETREMMALFDQLSDADQEGFLIMLRAWVREKVNRAASSHQKNASET